jgi:hypothetical protein
VFGHIADRISELARRRATAAGGRQFVACLAILGLYLQLAAGALCTACLPSGPHLSDVPICHPASAQADPARPDHAPQQPEQPCPFCALHCYAAMALPPALPVIAPVADISAQPLTRTAWQPRRHFTIAAQPRGPPQLG